jgi:predicted lipid-binding transport protein (Tim44 family)
LTAPQAEVPTVDSELASVSDSNSESARNASPSDAISESARNASPSDANSEWTQNAAARDESGQIAILLVGGLVAVALGGLILGAFARGLGARDAAQRAADLAALGGARAMRESYERLFEPPAIDGRANPRHLEKDAYLALGRSAAVRVAAANGAPGARVSFPDGATLAPVRIRVAVERRVEIGGRGVAMRALAEAELAPPPGVGPAAFASGGGYDGPLEYRQGKPTRWFSTSVSASGSRRRIGRRFSV